MRTSVYEQDLRSLNENAQIKVELSYQLGGINYFTYKKESRGLYLHITPVEVRDCGNGMICESFVGFSGIKFLVKELGRKSDKQQELLWNKILPHTRQLADLFEKGEYQSIMDKLNELL